MTVALLHLEASAIAEPRIRRRDRRFFAPGLALAPAPALSDITLSFSRDPLPHFDESDKPALVTDPVSEALIAVDDQFECLGSYTYAGWRYGATATWVRASVAQRLAMVVAGLPAGFGVAIFDAWRSPELQTELYVGAYDDPFLAPGYMAEPSCDPMSPAAHTTGGAVDCTLTYGGRALALGTAFDDFGPDAAMAAFEDRPGPVRDLRRLLFWAMHDQGFIAQSNEWWHFEFGTPRWAAVTGHPAMYGPAAPEVDHIFRD